MAATDPRREQEREAPAGRPRLASAPAEPARRPRWLPIAIAIVVLAAIAVVAYFVLYGGGGGGGGGGSGGGGGGGGYLVIAFSAERARRLIGRIRRRS